MFRDRGFLFTIAAVLAFEAAFVAFMVVLSR
jgi:hypothetical protein